MNAKQKADNQNTLVVLLFLLIIPRNPALEATPPKWTDLHSKIVPPEPTPTCIDLTLYPEQTIHLDSNNPILIRERHGWCLYSSRVWLALEVKGIRYDTYLLESRGDTYDGADADNISYKRPEFLEGLSLPRLKMPGSTDWIGADTEEDLLHLLKLLDKDYPNDNTLFPNDEVHEFAKAFQDCLPVDARTSRRAAWLFSGQEGYRLDALSKTTFVQILDRVDSLIASTTGPFFSGSSLTAADIVWFPMLERYAVQLPCLHKGLYPRNNDNDNQWPCLQDWYRAMDTVPAYKSRIQGDAPSWRKVLYSDPWWPRADLWHPRDTVGPKGELQATEEECQQAFCQGMSIDEEKTWSHYALTRPYFASSPAKEAASILIRNRQAIVKDAATWIYEEGYETPSDDDLDSALRETAVLLTTDGASVEEISDREHLVTVLTYLDARLCVPRDMGNLPATCIRKLFQTVSTTQPVS